MSFFQEYKRLDILCRDIYRSDKGVTSYIEEMEDAGKMRYRVKGWDDDYRMLKKYRYMRNQIAHDDITEEDICDPSDEMWIVNFYNRILNQNDPLALYDRLMKAPKPSVKKQAPKQSVQPQISNQFYQFQRIESTNSPRQLPPPRLVRSQSPSGKKSSRKLNEKFFPLLLTFLLMFALMAVVFIIAAAIVILI